MSNFMRQRNTLAASRFAAPSKNDAHRNDAPYLPPQLAQERAKKNIVGVIKEVKRVVEEKSYYADNS